MRSRTIFCFTFAGMLVTVASCVSLQDKQSSSPEPIPVPSQSAAPPTTPEAGDSNTTQSDTKIITMNLEGQLTEIELKRFHQDAIPFTTFYPEAAFTPEITSSGEGTGVRFYFSPTGKKDENAYISFFFPSGSNSLESIQDLLLGDRGILIKNGWELIDRTDIVSYPWAREKMLYQHQKNTETIVGAIYIGQEEGQTFYTLTHYPAEYGDGFEPRSNIVLENLQFDE